VFVAVYERMRGFNGVRDRHFFNKNIFEILKINISSYEIFEQASTEKKSYRKNRYQTESGGQPLDHDQSPVINDIHFCRLQAVHLTN
jgi:hypothetical protein